MALLAGEGAVAPDVLDKVVLIHFQVALRSPAGQNVLIDLAEFCRASETTFHKDARLHALLEGRREVFLRIVNFLNLTAEQIYLLSTGKQFNPREEDDNA